MEWTEDYYFDHRIKAGAELYKAGKVDRLVVSGGDLICLKPDMSVLSMDMVGGEIPSADNDSIIMAFAGAFTGIEFDKGHANIAGDHVSGGNRFKGYPCKRNIGAFTWSSVSGPKFLYKDYSSALDKATAEGGMGFAQEMMIHCGKAVKTTRPLGNRNVFRALCLDPHNNLALYESQICRSCSSLYYLLHGEYCGVV